MFTRLPLMLKVKLELAFMIISLMGCVISASYLAGQHRTEQRMQERMIQIEDDATLAKRQAYMDGLTEGAKAATLHVSQISKPPCSLKEFILGPGLVTKPK